MARTLVIDGDAETEPLLRDYFQRLGSNLIEACAFAKSSEEALTILHSGVEFDIALIAIDDEEMAGLSLFHSIEDQKLRIPRVALTRGGDLRLIRAAMIQGAMDFLIKPIPFDDFASTLERTIETVERRRKNWQERAAYSALKREIDIAADIQQRILPTDFPASEGYRIAPPTCGRPTLWAVISTTCSRSAAAARRSSSPTSPAKAYRRPSIWPWRAP